MLHPPATWTWTAQREQAAALDAAGAQSDEQRALAIGVERNTLLRWRKHPAYRARVIELVEAYRTEIKRRGIAERQNRLDALNDRWQKMQAVIEARAGAIDPDDPAHDPLGLGVSGQQAAALAAGFGTGLLALEWKQAGFYLRPQFKVDTGLLAEMRATEQQAAQELGQWDDGHSSETTVVIKNYVGIDINSV